MICVCAGEASEHFILRAEYEHLDPSHQIFTNKNTPSSTSGDIRYYVPTPKTMATFPLDLGPCLSRLNAFNVYRHNALTKEGAVRGGVSFDFVRKPATSVSDRCVHGCTSSVHPWHSPCRRTTDRSGCPAALHFTARWSPGLLTTPTVLSIRVVWSDQS